MKYTPTPHKNPPPDSRISIIIPVYRETGTIKKTISSLAESAVRHRAQIIVVDGEPGAGTIAVVQEKPFITTMVSRIGRACQMNAGADRATGDILLFLHADTTLPDHALESVIAVCRNDAIVGGAFDLSIDSNKPAYRLIEKVASLRSRITRIPYGDQAIFIKRHFFQRLGGFSPIPIMEDVDLMRRIKKKGARIIILDRAVKTSPRRWQRDGVVFGTLRNWALVAAYHLGVPPRRLASYYHRFE